MMQVIWDLKLAFIKDIIKHIPDESQVPYTTVSSVVRILEKKGYVGFNNYGKTYQYFPLVSKTAYAQFAFKKLLTNYFDGSVNSLLSFMVKDATLKDEEIKELGEFIEKH